MNNAGKFLFSPVEIQASDYESMFRNNVSSAINTTNKFLPLLKAGNSEDQGSTIVNLCSISSLLAHPNNASYVVSKHALLGYTRALRAEISGYYISVVALNLGSTLTASFSERELEKIGPKNLIPVQDVAKTIVFLTELSPGSVVEEILLRPRKGDIDFDS